MMNAIAKLSPNRPTITLRDLVKPNLDKREERVIKNALKGAKKDQDAMRAKARQLSK